MRYAEKTHFFFFLCTKVDNHWLLIIIVSPYVPSVIVPITLQHSLFYKRVFFC